MTQKTKEQVDKVRTKEARNTRYRAAKREAVTSISVTMLRGLVPVLVELNSFASETTDSPTIAETVSNLDQAFGKIRRYHLTNQSVSVALIRSLRAVDDRILNDTIRSSVAGRLSDYLFEQYNRFALDKGLETRPNRKRQRVRSA